jgi:histidinol-phosphate aminotransferase
MIRIRDDVRSIAPYRPGRPIADVAREYGFDPSDIVKLASNESPLPPVRQAMAAMVEEVGGINRYPDNDCRDLRHALAPHLDVMADQLWIGGGSSELLRVIATAVGGEGTTAVYAWPSFVVYRLATVLAGATPREVSLDDDHRHDLAAMRSAIDGTTTVVYVCNPNNPTGSHLPADAIAEFVAAVPEDVLVVVDEAYHEYVTAEDYASAVPLALSRPNVIVTRTFSKVYGLAALRVGYAVGRVETITELRKAQAPFSVTSVGQVGAVASLSAADEIAHRVSENRRERSRLEGVFADLGLEYVPSQANFVYLRLGASTEETSAAFLRHGVILRPFGDGWVRVSVGSPAENDRFLAALDLERERLAGS